MTDYPARFWVAISADGAAGYERNALGEWMLIGLVIYGPTTEKLRGTRLRGLEKFARGNAFRDVIPQAEPPTPGQVADSWSRVQSGIPAPAQLRSAMEPVEDMAYAAEIMLATSPEALRKQDGERPDDFYRRIVRAHKALRAVTNKPTAELARRAGVPAGTAAAWVSRAKARGLFNEEGAQS
jgi:hypothetical protein